VTVATLIKSLSLEIWLDGHPYLDFIRLPNDCSMADRYVVKEREQRQIYLYTIVSEYNGPLVVVHCFIDSVIYDMVVEFSASNKLKLDLIRPPRPQHVPPSH